MNRVTCTAVDGIYKDENFTLEIGTTSADSRLFDSRGNEIKGCTEAQIRIVAGETTSLSLKFVSSEPLSEISCDFHLERQIAIKE